MEKWSLLFTLTLLFLCISCHDRNLTVHLVPHSHNDAGWLKSFEEYYQETTKHILTNVMNLLEREPNKVFNWADIAFFHRWWIDQTPEMKNLVRNLVKKNRFVFIGGGWVMSDEALPSYKENMLQMRLGLDFLQDTFGVRPNIGWQIDPFGSSAATVAVLYKLGFDGFVGNRMSQNFKDKMASEDGFNFYWQGHQVSKNKDDTVLFTHILQKHYGLQLPNVWNEGLFLGKSMTRMSDYVYDREISPAIKAIQNISNHTEKDFHTMVTAGDDFMFTNADRVFSKFDELIKSIEKKGDNNGFNTKAKYDTMWGYFEGLHSMNLSYGVFKGDFLPYEERFPNWEDFWTGYYSTRLHMKRMIRHVFNDIQSTKTLLAIRATHHENNSIRFGGPFSFNVDKVQEKITDAERKWGIMMHHDAITGTHTVHTEPSYYRILHEALNYLHSARNLIDEFIAKKIPSSTIDFLNNIVGNLTNPKITHNTIVNPSGYYRIQIVNITVPIPENDDRYILYVQERETLTPITSSYYADIYELNTATSNLVKTRKIFFKLPMHALSDKQVYIFQTSDANDCVGKNFHCATKVEAEKVQGRPQMINQDIKLNFSADGALERFEYMSRRIAEYFSEDVTYHDMIRNTRSGLYIFNPRNTKVKVPFSNTEMYRYRISGLIDVLQVYRHSSEDRLLKTYIVNQDGCPNLRKQFFMEIQFETKRMAEVSFSLKKVPKSSSGEYKSYADDSMRLIERPIFDKSSKIPHTNLAELEGYYTYSCVHGGLIREMDKNSPDGNTDIFFGWANSNPIGCTFSDKSEVSFMIFRNIANSDNKGVNDRLVDRHITSTSFQFYIEKSVDGALFHKVRANTKINEPYGIFTKNIYKTKFDSLAVSSNLGADFLNLNGEHQISNTFGDIDIVDLKLMRHKILETFNDYELAIVLRNRYNGHIPITRGPNKHDEGLFKNEFIDTLKSEPKTIYRNNYDKSKQVLDEERYSLASLEDELRKSNHEPRGFHGLEPYELAEFRIVRSATLEALDIKKKETSNNTGRSGGRNLNCSTFEYLSRHHKVVNYFHKYIRSILFVLGILLFIGAIFGIKKLRDAKNKKKAAKKRHIRVSDISDMEE